MNMPVTMIYSRFATDIFTMLNVVSGEIISEQTCLFFDQKRSILAVKN